MRNINHVKSLVSNPFSSHFPNYIQTNGISISEPVYGGSIPSYIKNRAELELLIKQARILKGNKKSANSYIERLADVAIRASKDLDCTVALSLLSFASKPEFFNITKNGEYQTSKFFFGIKSMAIEFSSSSREFEVSSKCILFLARAKKFNLLEEIARSHKAAMQTKSFASEALLNSKNQSA